MQNWSKFRWSLQEVTSYFVGFILDLFGFATDLAGIWFFGRFEQIWTDLAGFAPSLEHLY